MGVCERLDKASNEQLLALKMCFPSVATRGNDWVPTPHTEGRNASEALGAQRRVVRTGCSGKWRAEGKKIRWSLGCEFQKWMRMARRACESIQKKMRMELASSLQRRLKLVVPFALTSRS
jgi:hypothetical protein